ncbi:uncharacterized protein zgc:174888 [Triplophysa rosa]|uniref:Uncharacterized protein n=1 Tax=Triplophysa rosa TaxID=992332 RepID=A0A9W7WQL0_TRIRA|nr:uncharacterized protein zgc:174888 [Triplophysa rosa]KAI7806511.1 hypothetical protein IRJ41_007297 [Triplophysa rosa]
MIPTVLLLLSVLTAQGCGCDDFMKTTVKNLQNTINREKTTGFPQVFPKNYVVSHCFNDSAPCNESCCVFRSAVFLSDSWIKLLQYLDRVHLKYMFISDLIYTLGKIAEETFLETPDVTAFPSIQSTPETLLSFTSSLFSRWLSLDCAFGKENCIFPIPSQEEEDDDLISDEENMENNEQVDEHQPIIEGVKGKIQFDPGPTSGYTELCFPGVSWWTLSFLWIATCASLI